MKKAFEVIAITMNTILIQIFALLDFLFRMFTETHWLLKLTFGQILEWSVGVLDFPFSFALFFCKKRCFLPFFSSKHTRQTQEALQGLFQSWFVYCFASDTSLKISNLITFWTNLPELDHLCSFPHWCNLNSPERRMLGHILDLKPAYERCRAYENMQVWSTAQFPDNLKKSYQQNEKRN